MAEVVLGMWTTHGPTLSTTPAEWLLRLPADHELVAGFEAMQDELQQLLKDGGGDDEDAAVVGADL